MAETQKESIAKIIDFLDLNQEGFDLSNYKKELKQKTLEGTLTIKDALFITLNEKGLKILEKSFVEDPNAKMLSQIFPSTTNIDIPGGGTLAVSPEPSSTISNWSNLVNKINTKTGQGIKEILNTPIQSYIREGVSQEFDMKGAKGGSSALRQGIFYTRKQLGFSEKEKEIVRNTYLDDTTLRQELGGSKTYGQKRLEGRGLATRSIRASDAPLITQAVKEGMSVITDPDTKAAIMYNILIPHRAVQVYRLRINPETNAKGNILKDATDPYLDGDQIVVPQAGAKKGQKRYTTIKLTPFMQNFLEQLAKQNPDRTYLFRDNNVGEGAFKTRINNALQLKGGIGERTQAFVDAGKFTRPVNTFGMLRKFSAMSTLLSVPGSAGNLRYIMGHTNMKEVASETGIDQQQKIHYIGDIQEGRTDLEVMKLYEDQFQTHSGASSKKELLTNTFNIKEITLPPTFAESTDDFKKLGQITKQTAAEFADYERYLQEELNLSDDTLERVKRLAPNAETFKAFMSAYSDDGIIDEDEVKSALDTLDAQNQLEKVASEIEKKPIVEQAQPEPNKFAGLFDDSPDLTNTSSEELKSKAEDILKRVVKKTPAVLGGAATLTLGAIEESLAADPADAPTLDPAESIPPASEMSDPELFSGMQKAASDRHSSDMAKRTTALARIDKQRNDLQARAFDAPAQMRAREANLTELDYTTPEQERMDLSKTLQDVDTSEAFTEQAQRARIAEQAARLFNR